MQPTSNAPRETPAEAAASLDPTLHTPLSGGSAPLASTEPTSGPEKSPLDDYKQKAAEGWQAAVDGGKQAIEKGKQWLDEQDLAAKAKELPQKAKDLGSKALEEINGLTNTQKAIGVGLLAAGVAFLLTRGSRRKKDDGDDEYRRRPQRSPFSHNRPYGQDDDSRGPGRRGWGSGRYSASAPGAGRSSRAGSGSGYTSPGGGARRDQGPASGSRYDAGTSGGQNPNNSDDLSSAF